MPVPRNLYEYDDWFRIIIGGATRYIKEPVGWDKVRIKATRDKDWWGFNYEFVDPKTTLTFPTREGLEEIKAVYDAKEGDGLIIFEYGYDELGVRVPQFGGTVNLNDYERTDEGVQVTIEKTVFSSKFRTRYDTKVAINAVTDLDGRIVVPPAPIAFGLHSRRIKKTAKAGGPEPSLQVQTNFGSSSFYNHIQVPTDNPITTELDGMFNLPLACTRIAPQTELRFQFEAPANGLASVQFKYSITVKGAEFLPPVGPPVPMSIGDAFYLEPRVLVERGGVLIQNFANPAMNYVWNGGFIHEFTHAFDWNFELDFLIGDRLYCYIGFVKNSTNDATLKDVLGHIQVEQVTELPATTTNVWRMWDVIQHTANCATGQAGALLSAFFGPGGCAYDYYLTNGFQIRNFEVSDRPLKTSMKDCFDALQAIWCMGQQFTLDAGGADVVKLEPVARLIGNRRAYDFTNIYDYTDRHAKEAVYNAVEIGYTKLPDDEVNTLDEFNTAHSYLLPVTTYKQTYTRKCPWIASGYLLEQIRREQFAQNPSSSASNDEEVFIIKGTVNRPYLAVSYSATAPDKIRFDLARMRLRVGDQFQISGDPANNGTIFTILAVDTVTNEYQVDPVCVTSSGVVDVLVLTTGAVAERNEAFSIVTGTLSPETAYNLRLTPRHMLLHHAVVLNIGLASKGDEELVQCTDAKNNGTLTTQFNEAEPCKGMAVNYVLVEGGNFRVADFNDRQTLSKPGESTFKTTMAYRDLLALKMRLIGQTNTEEDYGLVSWPDLDGRYWEGIVWALEYEPYTEELEVTVRKIRQIL